MAHFNLTYVCSFHFTCLYTQYNVIISIVHATQPVAYRTNLVACLRTLSRELTNVLDNGRAPCGGADNRSGGEPMTATVVFGRSILQ